MMGVKFTTKFTFTRSSQFSKLKLLLLLFSLSSVLGLCLRLLHYGKFPWKASNYFKALNTGSLCNTTFEVALFKSCRIPSLTLYCFEILCWWNLCIARSWCDSLLEWLIIVQSNMIDLIMVSWIDMFITNCVETKISYFWNFWMIFGEISHR